MDVEANLREAVAQAYSKAALDPRAKQPFPVGERFARSLGYPRRLLKTLPANARASFTGVSNVSVFASFPAGSRVLDLGCGAGLDAFIAAGRVGGSGQVFGIDFSAAMLRKAQAAATKPANLHFVRAAAEKLPFAQASMDVALVNGIFNLNPYREEIFEQLARVMKPCSEVYVAELILKRPLAEAVVRDRDNWFA